MDFWGFMGGVVVNNEVELAVAVIGTLSVYAFLKGQEFLVAMALVASAQNSPGGRIISGKQRKGPMTHIIVGLTLGADQDAMAKWADHRLPRLQSKV